jgi:carbamoyl-phosphate synthase small subunit
METFRCSPDDGRAAARNDHDAETTGPALLALEDGTVLEGKACGARGEAFGEMVFNTALTGYQEVLTDPSYAGQAVVMTYPMIGNYGITPGDDESRRPFLQAFIVRELCRYPSNWESVESVGRFLRRHGVVGIEGVDTRRLTKIIRTKGALRCAVSTKETDGRALVRRAKESPSMVGADWATRVTCDRHYEWEEELLEGNPPFSIRFPSAPKVVVLDFGVKYGILRCLRSMGCRVIVMPADTTADRILSLKPDGIMLSNGPGDPEPVVAAIETIKRLLDAKIPLFGICLGHQLLGLALGGKTFKLKFGHHGSNHPVKDLATGKVEITSQNHGFCVDLDSLPDEVRTTHVNLNDGTSEGMAHAELPVFSVQYHPESAAGPHDSRYLFERFGNLMLDRMRGKPPSGAAKTGLKGGL